jgi:hypothetical protein
LLLPWLTDWAWVIGELLPAVLALELFVLPWLTALLMPELAEAAEAALIPSVPASVSPSLETVTAPDSASESALRLCELLFPALND